MRKQKGMVYPGKLRLTAVGFAVVWLFCTFIPAFSGWSLPVPATAAMAEEDEPEEWDDSKDPYKVDWPDIPFRLVNTEGKEPGIDQESEWTLVLKPDWEDQNLPNRVQKVVLRLDARDLDWKDNLSHVWKKEYEGFPDRMTCTGLKIAGYYLLTAEVYYTDETMQEVNAVFTLQGAGKELITNVIDQAAAECKTSDEWQTALNLYNWLLNHLTYDETLSYYSADAILRDTGVCDSYARLYLLLCRAAGLDAYVIYGDTTLGRHAWNAVRINGMWYYADPTWDDHPVNDPAMSKEPAVDENGVSFGVPEYRYFMLSRQLMTVNNHVTYEWLDENKFTCEELPATSLAANYYIHTGLWEKWGVREGDTFRTIPDMISETISGGMELWSSKSIRSAPLYTRDSDDPVFRISANEIILLGYALKGYAVKLSDGSEITLDTYVYEAGDKSGWVLNVFPEGAPATDEAVRYELPGDLTEIKASEFEGNNHLGEVICPAGLVSIGPRAFANCKGLWNIRIPSTVQSIADDAFDGCEQFCIWTEHRDSLPVRYATEHDITVFVDDEEQDSNG